MATPYGCCCSSSPGRLPQEAPLLGGIPRERKTLPRGRNCPGSRKAPKHPEGLSGNPTIHRAGSTEDGAGTIGPRKARRKTWLLVQIEERPALRYGGDSGVLGSPPQSAVGGILAVAHFPLLDIYDVALVPSA